MDGQPEVRKGGQISRMAKMTKEEKAMAYKYAIASSGAVKVNRTITLPYVSIQHKEETNDQEARYSLSK